MMVVENQRPGDIWIINGERYAISAYPTKTERGYIIKMVDKHLYPFELLVDIQSDEV